jgi:hypothetical protein
VWLSVAVWLWGAMKERQDQGAGTRDERPKPPQVCQVEAKLPPKQRTPIMIEHRAYISSLDEEARRKRPIPLVLVPHMPFPDLIPLDRFTTGWHPTSS